MHHKKFILFAIYFIIIFIFCLLKFKNNDECFEEIKPYSHDYQLQTESEMIILDINKASVSKFAKLSGVSRSLAEKIVAYRNTNGDFQDISEIMTAGMPEKLFYQLQDYFYIEKLISTEMTSESETVSETILTTQEITTEMILTTQEIITETVTEIISNEILFSNNTESQEPEITFPLELNQASFEELCALPYIGSVTAQAIINYRESIGGFINCYQLLEVSGIGEFKFSEIQPYVYLETEYPLPESTESEIIPDNIDPTEPISETMQEIPMINLNTATKEELLLLPNCNEALAEEIIILRDRDIHIFYNILEITLAEHVTTELFAQWTQYLTVDGDGSTQIPYVPPLAENNN